MKKLFALMSVLVIASMLLAACGTPATTPSLSATDKQEMSTACKYGAVFSDGTTMRAVTTVYTIDGKPFICPPFIEPRILGDDVLSDAMIEGVCAFNNGVLSSGKTYKSSVVQLGLRFEKCP